MRNEPVDHTLEATALVHEAYLRLVRAGCVHWDSPGHLYVAAAEAMRRILVERARRCNRLRHGGGLNRVSLDEANRAATDDSWLIPLDLALGDLETLNARKANVVKLRYFAGFSVPETAKALGVSPRTVKLDWAFARAWLKTRVDGLLL